MRRASDGDGEFLYRLHCESMRGVVEATWGQWDDQRQRAWHSEWFSPARLSIITAEGEDVGVLDCEVRADGTLYLARIEILPAFQSRGIGGRVVQQLIGGASEVIHSIELDVLAANVGARRFYQSLGFEAVASTGPKCRMRLFLG